MKFLFLSCHKATELMEKKHHLKLSWVENMQLRLHNIMCGVCALYEKQSAILEGMLKKNLTKENIKIIENEELINKIIENISQK